ncbi:MAG: Ldh family oxidoreductase [SAR202 cluster bacterium]|nr:Ldh family oxidoreductase [SAR202 cluster bacterium]
MAITMVRVPIDRLEAFTLRAFRAMGTSEEESVLCTRGLIQSEMRCHPGQNQGVRRLPVYHERISKGWYTLGAPFQIVKESPSLALVDAHNGLGSVMGQRAMALAVRKARVSGIGTVVVRHSTHFGSAGVHARLALEQDCLGVAMTNAGPEIPAWGGKSEAVGTNPWAIAAPTSGLFPVVLDMAWTMVDMPKLRWLSREGETRIPKDWALDEDGNETEDLSRALRGIAQGIGRHKGYGLAMMTDALTGVIGGGAFGLAPYSNPAAQDVAHTFVALDIAWFMPVAEFKSRMDAFVREVKSSRLRPGFTEILAPGELDYRKEIECRRVGTNLDLELFESLRRLAEVLKIKFDIIS